MIHLNDLLEVWGAAMVRASWQAGLLALVVWGVCRILPSIPARFQAWLWRLAVLKFLVAVVWYLPVELPVLPSLPAAAEASVLVSRADSTLSEAPTEPSLGLATTPSHSVPCAAILLIAWVVGVGWGAAHIARACRSASRLRKSSRICDDSLLRDATGRVARTLGLRRQPALLEAAGQGSPLLLGILHPAVIVPATTLRRLDSSERELVIGHELAHFRHSDVFWGLFAAGVRTLFFFHPAAWLCERKLRLAQEVAADELAMSLRGDTPAAYAQQLLQIVLKIGSQETNPAKSIAVAGSHESLKERFAAMRHVVTSSGRLRIALALFSLAVGGIGMIPWALVAAESPPASAVEAAPVSNAREAASTDEQPAKTLTQGRGKFVSFKNGTLTLDGPSGRLVWKEIDASTKAYLGMGESSDKDRGYRPVETLDALSKVKAGTQIYVGTWFGYEKRHGVFIDDVPGKAIGTFVSFKNGSLSLLAQDRPAGSFTKKYGNSLFIRNLPAGISVEESVDGGDFERIGIVKEVLADVAEGTLVTVHFLGEGNVTLIQIGVPRQ
ncbi:M56 family metallopeptidase [Lignipirellula cremea]|uniref:Regulatory protein BlaR1 n=1 Tax=Lignipirellula cremea TaxID=2528010 RepID=A0A518DZ14_9BACT|nr:M56 family metallopeptidase [Lignipirellula cremea]QDU97041.1 Regulatory protein BlaR1 [Lignipirellula cremea]